MAEQMALLEQLAPIYEPDLPVSFLPAPGYIMLGALMIFALLGLGWRLWQYWQQRKPQREAYQLLTALQQQTPLDVAAINVLLKRLVKAYSPMHPMLSATPSHWQDYLQQQLPPNFHLPDLNQMLYQAPNKQHSEAQQQLLQCAFYLVKHLDPRRCQREQQAKEPAAGVRHA